MAVAIQPVVFSLIADLYVPTQRGRVTTAVIIGQVAGIAAAFALGGMLLTLAGGSGAIWQKVMLWLTVPMIPMVFVTFYLREPPRTGQVIARPSGRQIWEELRLYWRVIGLLALGIILVETAVGGMLIWSAPMLSRKFGLAPDRVGAVMATGMLISGIIGPVAGGMLADLCQRTRGSRGATVAVAVVALVSAPVGLFPTVTGATYGSALLITEMTFMLAIAVMGMTLFIIVIPNELRGLCMSVLVAANLLVAFAVAPVAVSLLAQFMGGLPMIGKALSMLCICSSLLSAAAFYLARFAPLPAAPSQRSQA
jgi:MFS family permease